MKILGIETSCDETAVCLIECSGSLKTGDLKIEVLGNALHSQIESHKEFGGVVPMMAKREHAKNLIPLFLKVMPDQYAKVPEADDFNFGATREQLERHAGQTEHSELDEIFGRETEFKEKFIEMIGPMGTIDVNAIAVTQGPGLEPALWMGIIFAQALSLVFDIPLIPVNHMEGHIMSVLPTLKDKKIEFPAISLLISGGHTELVLIKDWRSYEILGETRDDAVGEAFDKVARMLGLPYPGGPEISKLASVERLKIENQSETRTSTPKYILPRPMMHSEDYDFSFSGLKTAVLYSLKKDDHPKEVVAKEFEDAVTDVLVSKTIRAIEEFGAKTLILGGGVVSNSHIRNRFEKEIQKLPEVSLLIPDQELRTDNAIMIAIAGYEKKLAGFEATEIRANGTLRL